MKASQALPSTYTAGMLQSKAYRALSNFMSAYLKPFGLSLPEWKVLGSIHENHQLTPTDIASNLGVKLPIATRLLKSLEAKKLLKRHTDSDDSRVIRVAITPAGDKLATKLEKDLRLQMRQFLSDISHEELLVYTRVIGKLAAKI